MLQKKWLNQTEAGSGEGRAESVEHLRPGTEQAGWSRSLIPLRGFLQKFDVYRFWKMRIYSPIDHDGKHSPNGIYDRNGCVWNAAGGVEKYNRAKERQIEIWIATLLERPEELRNLRKDF
jgi:hypothetical protein